MTAAAPAAALKDDRNGRFLVLLAKGYAFVFAGLGLFVVAGIRSPWVAVAYLAVYLLVFLGPITILIHNIAHRGLMRGKAKWVETALDLTLFPFFGHNGWGYDAHHLGMHHPENNLDADQSSTLRYQRDSVVDFARYFGRFFVFGNWDLYHYLTSHKRTKLLRSYVLSEIYCLGLMALGMALAPYPTFVLLVAPYGLTRLLLMVGNWSQHAFIDAAAPDDPYLNSVNFVESRYNAICFNDGYHTLHHQRPTLHWTELPRAFERDLEAYREKRAIVFRKLDWFQVWFLLMWKRYDILARHYLFPELFGGDQARIEEHLRLRARAVA